VIGGVVAPGFEPVLRAFQDNFAQRGEVGAAVAVFVDGACVVDLHGGVADRATGAPWTADTLQILFSATKGLVATCFLRGVDRGDIDLDAPVASFWPAFAAGGKGAITVRQVLDHTAGLVALDRPLSLADLEGWSTGRAPGAVLAALETQEPVWEPGTAQGYHAITYGLYAGEILRRLTDRPVGAVLRDDVAAPLGADVHLGLSAVHEPRVATLYPNGPRTFLRDILPRTLASRSVEGRLYRSFLVRESLTRRAFANPAALGIRGGRHFGSPRVRAMALPWMSAVGSARGLATVYDALSRPGFVSEPVRAEAMRRSSWGWDRVLQKPMGFSVGFVKDELTLYSPTPETFGHPGAGGALGFADPVRRIGFGYVMNRMDFRLRSPRALALARAVYSSLPS
jgi:CubicO group peptidase (beta-lactamase class C family)